MTTPSLNIAWSLAEIEAAAAGFSSILPSHFWMGCCKGGDLDMAGFLGEANPEIRKQEPFVVRDFLAVREALAAGKADPTRLRRALRARLGKKDKPAPRPLHRHPDLRAAFAAGAHLAEIAGGSAKPVHVLFSLLQNADPILTNVWHPSAETGRHSLRLLNTVFWPRISQAKRLMTGTRKLARK